MSSVVEKQNISWRVALTKTNCFKEEKIGSLKTSNLLEAKDTLKCYSPKNKFVSRKNVFIYLNDCGIDYKHCVQEDYDCLPLEDKLFCSLCNSDILFNGIEVHKGPIKRSIFSNI